EGTERKGDRSGRASCEGEHRRKLALSGGLGFSGGGKKRQGFGVEPEVKPASGARSWSLWQADRGGSADEEKGLSRGGANVSGRAEDRRYLARPVWPGTRLPGGGRLHGRGYRIRCLRETAR